MDNLDFVKELALAFKFELIRYRFAVVVLAVIVLFSVLAVGVGWQNQYMSQARLEIDDTNIIQPLLKGAAEFGEIDRVEEAKKFLYSKPLLEAVARRLQYIDDNTNPGEVGQVLRALQRNILIESEGKKSNYFTVAYFSSDPEVAFETTKVVVQEFVQYHQLAQRKEGENAFDFISKQVNGYKKRLELAELALKDFKAQSLDTDEKTVRSRISELEQEIQELRLGVQESESTIKATKEQLGSESEYLEVQGRVFTLRQQKQFLETQLNQLRLQFQDSYPDIVTLNSQIAEIDQKIYESGGGKPTASGSMGGQNSGESNPALLYDELRKQLSTAEVEVETKKRRLQSLTQLLKEEYEKAGIVASNQAKLADLMRDYTVTKGVYEEMLSRKENAELSVAITREGQGLNYRIVTEPVYPLQPSGLTFLHFLFVAPVLAIGAPIGLIIALILLDPRIRTMSNLTTTIDERVEILGIVPHYHTALSSRLLKKDMLLLSSVIGLVSVIYGYIAFIGVTTA